MANHVAGFCDEVGMLTMLGADDSREEFVRRHLKDNIRDIFHYRKKAPTTIKKRYVESYFKSKLFEVYTFEDRKLGPEEVDAIYSRLDELLDEYDVVIVADFGHALLADPIIELLCDKARFMGLNTQVNAGNKGFNTISKYRRADLITLNEGEIRWDARDQHGNVEGIIQDLSQRSGCERILVTRGHYGNLVYEGGDVFHAAPALATRVVDRVGAGDAVFALSVLYSAAGAPMEMVGFIGNVAGAIATGIMGNRTAVERSVLVRSIQSLLK